MGQPFNDSGFADAWFTNQYRIILGAAAQHLDDAADLLIAPDDRVKLALPGQFSEVAPILFKRLVFPLRMGIGHALRTTNGSKGLQDVSAGESGCSQDALCGFVVAIKHSQEQMLNAQVLILEVAHFAPCIFQHFAQARRYTRLTATIDARHALNIALDHALCLCQISSYLLDYLLDYAAFL